MFLVELGDIYSRSKRNEEIFIGTLFVGASLKANAVEVSTVTKIDTMSAYSNYGNGDVHIELENNSSSCQSGYFINKSSSGFETILSIVLAAYHSKASLAVKANEGAQWPGSSNPVCEIYSVV